MLNQISATFELYLQDKPIWNPFSSLSCLCRCINTSDGERLYLSGCSGENDFMGWERLRLDLQLYIQQKYNVILMNSSAAPDCLKKPPGISWEGMVSLVFSRWSYVTDLLCCWLTSSKPRVFPLLLSYFFFSYTVNLFSA